MPLQTSLKLLDGSTDAISGFIESQAIDCSGYKNILLQGIYANVGDIALQLTSAENPDGTPDATSWMDVALIPVSSPSLWQPSSIIPICAKWLRITYQEAPVVGGGSVIVYVTEQG